MKLLFNFSTCYFIIKERFPHVVINVVPPLQIILRMNTCTFLLFTSGQFRIMGKVLFDEAYKLTELMSFIYSDIPTSLHLVNTTAVMQMHPCICPINLYHIAKVYNSDKNVLFEPELFPALSLYHWKPCHVNVFHNGKVIVLGKNACNILNEVDSWIFNTVLLLPEFK